MGCVDQFQARDPVSRAATDWTGAIPALAQTEGLGFNDAQIATSKRLLGQPADAQMFTSVDGLGSAALRVRDMTYNSRSPDIPADQWQIELDGWFETSLANLQNQVVAFATKEIDDLGLYPFGNLTFYGDERSELEAMCDQQIIRSVGGFQSFTVFGVILIVALGVAIVIASLCVDSVMKGFRRYAGNRYKSDQWTMDGVLHLQRQAFEGKRRGTWLKKASSVPVTLSGESLISPAMKNNKWSPVPPEPTNWRDEKHELEPIVNRRSS